MPRQPFSDFLDLDQQSFSPRGGRGGGGRGRGGGRGGGAGGNGNNNASFGGFGSPSTSAMTPDGGRGRGRGRGGGSGFRGRGGASLRADYTAVPPIDYSRINKENYKTMTGSYLVLHPSCRSFISKDRTRVRIRRAQSSRPTTVQALLLLLTINPIRPEVLPHARLDNRTLRTNPPLLSSLVRRLPRVIRRTPDLTAPTS